MTKNNDIQTEYYGIIKATINHQIRHVDLTIKRYAEPVSLSQVESMMKWALGAIRKKYSDYTIQKEVTYDV